MNNAKPLWSQKIGLLKTLSSIFPNAYPQDMWKDVQKITQTNFEKERLLLLSAAQECFTNKKFFDQLQSMHAAGYGLQHMMLYMAAPETSHLGTQTTRSQYLQKWNAENNFVPQSTNQEALERGTFALSSLVAVGGALAVFGGVSFGFLVNKPDVVETFKIMSAPMGMIQDLTEAITSPSMPSAISSLVALGGALFAGYQLNDQIKKAQHIDLRSTLHALPEGEGARDCLILQVGSLSKSMQHLVSHFSPEELSLFVSSNEDTPKNMWRANPPNFEQRCNSLFCEEGSWAQKWRTKLDMTCSQWDNDTSSFRQPINLKESLAKFRQHIGAPSSEARSAPSL